MLSEMNGSTVSFIFMPVMIALSAGQSSAPTLIHHAILFIDISTMLDISSSFVNWDAIFDDNC